MQLKKLIAIATVLTALGASEAEGRQPHSGYRGFIDWSNDLRSDTFYGFPRQTSFYTGVTTSHGYQINSIFFAGAGIGAEHCSNLDNWIVPVFAEGRADFSFGAFTPFADIRLGANMAEGVGVYFSPSVGYRFNWGRKAGVNLALGMTLGGYKCELYNLVIDDNGYTSLMYVGSERRARPYFTFRVGFDF